MKSTSLTYRPPMDREHDCGRSSLLQRQRQLEARNTEGDLESDASARPSEQMRVPWHTSSDDLFVLNSGQIRQLLENGFGVGDPRCG